MKYILMISIFVSAFFIVPQLAVSEQMIQTIRCESQEFTPRNCQLPIAPPNAEIKEIRMIQQLSKRPCIEGKTWMANPSAIYVSNGCRADFKIFYWISNRSERHEHWRNTPDSGHWDDGSDNQDQVSPSTPAEDPTEIVLRSFEDVLGKRPSREEIRYYRSLIIERGWSERQVRNDLRTQSRSRKRY